MNYIIRIGTTEAQWHDTKPVPTGWVRFEGPLPDDPIWDAALNNIREKTPIELAADRAIENGKRADTDDLRARVAAALTRLDDIVTNGGTYTNTQVRAAVVDMAQMLRALIRHERHRL